MDRKGVCMEDILYNPMVSILVQTIYWLIVLAIGIKLFFWGKKKILTIKKKRKITEKDVLAIGIGIALFIIFIAITWICKNIIFMHRTAPSNVAVIKEEKTLEELKPLDYKKIKEEREKAKRKKKEEWLKEREEIRKKARQESDDYFKSLLEDSSK